MSVHLCELKFYLLTAFNVIVYRKPVRRPPPALRLSTVLCTDYYLILCVILLPEYSSKSLLASTTHSFTFDRCYHHPIHLSPITPGDRIISIMCDIMLSVSPAGRQSWMLYSHDSPSFGSGLACPSPSHTLCILTLLSGCIFPLWWPHGHPGKYCRHTFDKWHKGQLKVLIDLMKYTFRYKDLSFAMSLLIK